MRKAQKLVASGVMAGVIFMALGLAALAAWLPGMDKDAQPGARLAFAAKWVAFAAAPLILSVAAVGNARFKSEAIDPLAGEETPSLLVDARVADNTTQQYLLFSAAAFGVAAAVPGPRMSIVSAAAVIFVVMRFAFWLGYRLNPLYRAFGMAGTLYLNLFLLGYAALSAWR